MVKVTGICNKAGGFDLPDALQLLCFIVLVTFYRPGYFSWKFGVFTWVTSINFPGLFGSQVGNSG